jgi:hypothetical protein
MMEYSWWILAVMLSGFVLVNSILQVINRNPVE